MAALYLAVSLAISSSLFLVAKNLTSLGSISARVLPKRAASTVLPRTSGRRKADLSLLLIIPEETRIELSSMRRLSFRRSSFGRRYEYSIHCHRLNFLSSEKDRKRTGNCLRHSRFLVTPAQHTVSPWRSPACGSALTRTRISSLPVLLGGDPRTTLNSQVLYWEL